MKYRTYAPLTEDKKKKIMKFLIRANNVKIP